MGFWDIGRIFKSSIARVHGKQTPHGVAMNARTPTLLKIVAASIVRVDYKPVLRLLAPLDNQVKSNIIPLGFQ
jgi:hypothetical protein